NRFNAYLTQPHTPARALMLIYPDVRGLHQFYKDLALRYAELGIAALAMDYFGRSAGLTSRAENFEYMPHVGQLTLPGVIADARASLDHLRAAAGQDKPCFLVGFCMGGGLVIQTATEGLGLTGGFPFYAGLSRAPAGAKGTALEVAPTVKVPLL